MLTLPPGSYALQAKVRLEQGDIDEDVLYASCRLDVTGTPGLDSAAIAIGQGDVFTPNGEITLMSAVTKATLGFNVAVACRDADVGDVQWYDVKIVATRVTSTSIVQL